MFFSISANLKITSPAESKGLWTSKKLMEKSHAAEPTRCLYARCRDTHLSASNRVQKAFNLFINIFFCLADKIVLQPWQNITFPHLRFQRKSL